MRFPIFALPFSLQLSYSFRSIVVSSFVYSRAVLGIYSSSSSFVDVPPPPPPPEPLLVPLLLELELDVEVVVHAEPEQVMVFDVLSVFVAVPEGLLVAALEML